MKCRSMVRQSAFKRLRFKPKMAKRFKEIL